MYILANNLRYITYVYVVNQVNICIDLCIDKFVFVNFILKFFTLYSNICLFCLFYPKILYNLFEHLSILSIFLILFKTFVRLLSNCLHGRYATGSANSYSYSPPFSTFVFSLVPSSCSSADSYSSS